MRTKFDSETFDMLNFVLLYIVPLLIMTVSVTICMNVIKIMLEYEGLLIH